MNRGLLDYLNANGLSELRLGQVKVIEALLAGARREERRRCAAAAVDVGRRAAEQARFHVTHSLQKVGAAIEAVYADIEQAILAEEGFKVSRFEVSRGCDPSGVSCVPEYDPGLGNSYCLNCKRWMQRGPAAAAPLGDPDYAAISPWIPEEGCGEFLRPSDRQRQALRQNGGAA